VILLGRFIDFLRDISPFLAVFFGSLVITLFLTPLCRKLAIRLGMVDMPSKRRINKEPIPRSGGLAIYVSYAIVVSLVALIMGESLSPTVRNHNIAWLIFLSGVLCIIGLIDDKFGMKPVLKFAGQLGVAVSTVFLCNVGFRHIPFFSAIPVWLDLVLTVFWIVGAINAFNLIDGVDGLATGLAVIAAFGMGMSLVFIGYPNSSLMFFVFIGACLGFLRYNFNPASVFLGDTGSMFLGYTLAVLPLLMKAGDSFLVSLGVPVLCMGVPIFDTFLAIVRRSIRAQLKKHETEDDVGNSKVMQADTDHLHHRKLRKFLSQKAVVVSLYLSAMFLVLLGLAGVLFRDYAAGIFIIGFMVAIYVVVSDMKRIELWDAGKLLNTIAHSGNERIVSRFRALRLPIQVATDLVVLLLSCVMTLLTIRKEFTTVGFQINLAIIAVPVFLSVAAFRNYSVCWARAMLSNYVTLVTSVIFGSFVSYAITVVLCVPECLSFGEYGYFIGVSVLGLVFVRIVRQLLRDTFYILDVGKMKDGGEAKRVLVYGAGLRYRAFRRELVRKSSVNNRYIVGIIDDDIYLKSLYIGGAKVLGTLEDLPGIVKEYRVDSIVIACDLSPERLEETKMAIEPFNLETTFFTFSEMDILKNKTENKEGK
jgi:UDP-N-acetylmuramyl pentapeptide phosphotransferase/UDP-N-acetylglucosamine-1-phosphate transferase